MLKAEKIPVYIVNDLARRPGIYSGLHNGVFLDIHAIGGTGLNRFITFDQHCSHAAEGIQNLGIFFHIFGCKRRRQGRIHRTDACGNDFLAIGKAIIF